MDKATVCAATMRSLRDVPPAHYTLRMTSFSLFRDAKVGSYESGAFEAGGYKKLCIYPDGNPKMNVKGHISCYLAMEDTETLPPGWEVNVSFKLFVFDHVRDKYLTIQDAEGGIRRFNWIKSEWGVDKFLPLDTFNDASNGYLVDDCCVFGAEVFVIKNAGKREIASLVKDPADNIYTWRIDSFSKKDQDKLTSEEFVVGEHKWTLVIYPKGESSSKGKNVSLFLRLADCRTLPSHRKIYAEYKLRMRDQIHGKHCEKIAAHWFDSFDDWGYRAFMALSKLDDASNGFKANDVVTVEAEITLISSFEEF